MVFWRECWALGRLFPWCKWWSLLCLYVNVAFSGALRAGEDNCLWLFCDISIWLLPPTLTRASRSMIRDSLRFWDCAVKLRSHPFTFMIGGLPVCGEVLFHSRSTLIWHPHCIKPLPHPSTGLEPSPLSYANPLCIKTGWVMIGGFHEPQWRWLGLNHTYPQSLPPRPLQRSPSLQQTAGCLLFLLPILYPRSLCLVIHYHELSLFALWFWNQALVNQI